MACGRALGLRGTFADVAATVADIFSLKMENGTSFGEDL
jgi:phosphopentomutase